MKNEKTPNFEKSIILHPEFEKLKIEVEKLKTELSMLVLERDNLLYQECKNIKMVYLLTFGRLEFKAYEIECAILRLKRKIELIQVSKNRQEKIDLFEIDNILDTEFLTYQLKLNEMTDNIKDALERSQGEMLTGEESRELKRLYHKIVKALHPDLNPNLDNSSIQLFYLAVKAYEAGDINELQLIEIMILEPTSTIKKFGNFEDLVEEKGRLTKLMQSVRDKIIEIKSEFPYTMKSIIQSPAKIKAKKAELADHIHKLNELLGFYTEKVAEMLRE